MNVEIATLMLAIAEMPTASLKSAEAHLAHPGDVQIGNYLIHVHVAAWTALQLVQVEIEKRMSWRSTD